MNNYWCSRSSILQERVQLLAYRKRC